MTQLRTVLILVAAAAVEFPSLAARAGEIEISNAWARATPPGVSTAAGYMDVRSAGTADRLLGARSAVAERVELHTSTQDDGLMRMRKLDNLPIEAGETLRFEPGGRHLMFVGIRRPFAPGETVAVTLIFERDGEIVVELPVRDMREAGH